MQTINEAMVRLLYETGGFLGRSILGDWWLYEAKNQFDKARSVQPDLPTALAVAGVLVPSGRNRLADVTLYSLAPTPE